MALVVSLAVGGCDSPDKTPPDGTEPPPNNAVTIRGNERLGWDQMGPSAAQVRQYQYRLYVDQDGRPLTGVQCGDTQGSGGFQCSAQLSGIPNGPHTLAVSATSNGVEGARSAPFAVVVDSNRQVAGEVSPVGTGAETSLCADTQVPQCYDRRLHISLEESISSVASLPDGRLLFVQAGRQIRVIENGRLLPEPAFVSQGSHDQLLAVMPDGKFDSSRAIVVAAIEPGRADRRLLTITRYRELANRLAQGTTIIELSVAPDGQPLVATDASGLIYIVVPADGHRTASPDGFSGTLLRYSPDGTVPWDSGQQSPVMATAYSQPTALALDLYSGRVWIAGGIDQPGLASISARAPAAAPARLVPATGITSDAIFPRLVSMAFMPGAPDSASRLFVVDANGGLSQASSSPGAQGAAFARIPSIAEAFAVSVSPGPEGSITVVYRSGDSWSLATLKPR
jgi:hypothetical protein